MPEQSYESGLEVLIDAAGADILLSPPQNSGDDKSQPPAKRVKLFETSAPAPATSSNLICHICQRVYERADHLTRHLRSHENARPYQCTRCDKRFNRA